VLGAMGTVSTVAGAAGATVTSLEGVAGGALSRHAARTRMTAKPPSRVLDLAITS